MTGPRGTAPRWLDRVPKGHAVALLALLALTLYPAFRPYDTYYQTVLCITFLLGVQAVSWNIISGYAGYVSLGHSAFLGIGSYTAAIIAERAGVNPLWMAPIGGVVAVVMATLLGLVVLRTSGHAFVIITIALLLSAQIVAVNWRSLTNGSDGITLDLPPWSRDIQNLPFYYVFLGLFFLTVVFSAMIRRTKLGTGLVAIREDEGKAAAIGVNTTRYKVTAFAASAFFIGVAGGVYAYFLTFLNPIGAFTILGSVTIVLSALAGGRGTLYGPVVGAFIVGIGQEMATVYGGSSSRVLLFGVALMLIVLFLPAGLLPTVEAWWRRRHTTGTEYQDQAGALGSGTLQVRDRALASAVVADTVEAVATRLHPGSQRGDGALHLRVARPAEHAKRERQHLRGAEVDRAGVLHRVDQLAHEARREVHARHDNPRHLALVDLVVDPRERDRELVVRVRDVGEVGVVARHRLGVGVDVEVALGVLWHARSIAAECGSQ